ncbi:MAG: hypothetical protein WCF03_16140 [Nitrososphaeraceae archaeon]
MGSFRTLAKKRSIKNEIRNKTKMAMAIRLLDSIAKNYEMYEMVQRAHIRNSFISITALSEAKN